MTNVVDLELRRILLESARAFDQIEETAQQGLDKILCADVSKFDGRMLRKTRDRILNFRRMLVVNSPEGRKLVEARVGTLNRALTVDETLDALAPLLAEVSVRFA